MKHCQSHTNAWWKTWVALILHILSNFNMFSALFFSMRYVFLFYIAQANHQHSFTTLWVTFRKLCNVQAQKLFSSPRTQTFLWKVVFYRNSDKEWLCASTFNLANENETLIAALWEVKSIPQTNAYDNETGATFLLTNCRNCNSWS